MIERTARFPRVIRRTAERAWLAVDQLGASMGIPSCAPQLIDDPRPLLPDRARRRLGAVGELDRFPIASGLDRERGELPIEIGDLHRFVASLRGDRDELVALLLSLSEVAGAQVGTTSDGEPEHVVSVDLNPLIISGTTPIAVDALVEVAPLEAASSVDGAGR